MRKILSIPLLILILFSGITVNIATHYCGGFVASTKINLTGEVASCGMESHETGNSSELVFAGHCCDNTISAYTLSSNYLLSAYYLNDPLQQIINSIDFTIVSGIIPEIFINISDKIRPPGTNCPESADQPVLCIFRI